MFSFKNRNEYSEQAYFSITCILALALLYQFMYSTILIYDCTNAPIY